MSRSSNTTAIEVCATLFGSLITVALVVLSIITLVGESNADMRDTCPGTKLWWVLLVEVLVLGFRAGSAATAGDSEDPCGTCTSLLLAAGIATWGLVEACTQCARRHLADSNVRKMVLIWSSLVVAVCGAVLIIGLGTIILGTYKARSEPRRSPRRPVSAALSLEDGDEGTEHTTIGTPPQTTFRTEV